MAKSSKKPVLTLDDLAKLKTQLRKEYDSTFKKRKLILEKLAKIQQTIDKVDERVEYLKSRENIEAVKDFNKSKDSFYIWKKAKVNYANAPLIVRLIVPEKAKRIMCTYGVGKYTDIDNRKVRVSEAVVDAIYSPNTGKKYPRAISRHDPNFEYTIGATIKPRDKFNTTQSLECVSGIHGFLNEKCAKNYW